MKADSNKFRTRQALMSSETLQVSYKHRTDGLLLTIASPCTGLQKDEEQYNNNITVGHFVLRFFHISHPDLFNEAH